MLKTSLLILASVLSEAPSDTVDVPENRSSLLNRVAEISIEPQQPQNLADVYGTVRDVFEARIALETLPDDCRGADTLATVIPPFAITRGETFGSAMARFEAISEHRWKFEELGSIPVLRPNTEVLGQGNALDTRVSLDIEKASVWDSLCALARAVNRKGSIHPKAHPLIIRPNSIVMARKPEPILMKEAVVTVKLEDVTAREALCAILSMASKTFTYFYICRPESQDVSVLSCTATGSVDRGGGRMDKSDMEYWTDENLRKIQS